MIWVKRFLAAAVAVGFSAGSPASASLEESLGALEGAGAFVRALEETGLLEELVEREAFTLLVPTAEGLEGLPEGLWEELSEPENEEIFRSLLAHHIIPRRLSAEELESGEILTWEGETVTIYAGPFGLQTGGAPVVETDIPAGETGLAHRIDGFLLPQL